MSTAVQTTPCRGVSRLAVHISQRLSCEYPTGAERLVPVCTILQQAGGSSHHPSLECTVGNSSSRICQPRCQPVEWSFHFLSSCMSHGSTFSLPPCTAETGTYQPALCQKARTKLSALQRYLLSKHSTFSSRLANQHLSSHTCRKTKTRPRG